jgi:Putative transposase
VQQHAASFIAHTEASTGAELPRFIKDEFDAFLECGILAHGFLRLRWGEHQRQELARLCRYIARQAIANERQLWRSSDISYGSQAGNQSQWRYAIKCRITSGCRGRAKQAGSCFAGAISARP